MEAEEGDEERQNGRDFERQGAAGFCCVLFCLWSHKLN